MTETTLPLPPPDEGRNPIYSDRLGLDRLIFFSDAVYAIAITLLALDIRLPPSANDLSNDELLRLLINLWPSYLGYAISFLVIGAFWISHHRRFRVMARYDNRLLFLNLLVLMTVAFIPFPTTVLSEHGNRTATVFYALAIAVVGLTSGLEWWYAVRRELVTPGLSAAQRQRQALRPLLLSAVFLLSIPIAFVNPAVAMLSWLLIIPALRWVG